MIKVSKIQNFRTKSKEGRKEEGEKEGRNGGRKVGRS